jgi:hypothetical protein
MVRFDIYLGVGDLMPSQSAFPIANAPGKVLNFLDLLTGQRRCGCSMPGWYAC